MGNATSSPSLPMSTNNSMCNGTAELCTASRINTTMGSHQFIIQDYLRQKGRGFGVAIFSKPFSVGNHDWAILCDLDGNKKADPVYISVFLQYYPKSENDKVSVTYSLSLLDHTTGAPAQKRTASKTFTSESAAWGWTQFIERDKLEESNLYLIRDSLTIICNVTVINDPETYSYRFPPTIKPAILHKQLGNLLSVEKGADVNFEVDGKSFLAHRSVLAASSPVFRALVDGQMKEAREQKIKINNIQAAVFEAILLYIYTDNLPEIEILTDIGMTQHLLVAADYFHLDKLRLSCEKKLCAGLAENNVSTALALAEQHNLYNLKAACFKFLSTPKTLMSATSIDGFMHLVKSCPTIEKELNYMITVTKK